MSTTSDTLPGIRDSESTASDTLPGIREPKSAENAESPGGRIYRGRSIEELIPRIQAELGADAIVLRRRTGLLGGVGGFFQRPFVEIEASGSGDPERSARPRIDLYDGPAATPASPPAPASFARTLASARQETESTPAGAVEMSAFEEMWSSGESSPVRSEVAPLAPAADACAGAQGESPSVRSEVEPQARATPAGGRARRNVERSLLGAGLSERFTRELIDGAAAHVVALTPRTGLAQAVRRALEQRIPVSPPLSSEGAAIALVGPGGSGKTECCTALLGAYLKRAALPAGYVTILAGQRHGELEMLLGPRIVTPVPATSPRAAKALAEARSGGLAIIDTPAVSAADRPAIRELASLLGKAKPDRVVIALPATLGAAAAEQLLKALGPLKADSVAITHADETDQLGVAVQAACEFGLAPEYLLGGGRGSAKLTRLDPAELANRLLQ